MYLVSILLLILTKIKGEGQRRAKLAAYRAAEFPARAGRGDRGHPRGRPVPEPTFRNLHPVIKAPVLRRDLRRPCLLILLQPDLGEVIIWVPTVMALLFIAGIPPPLPHGDHVAGDLGNSTCLFFHPENVPQQARGSVAFLNPMSRPAGSHSGTSASRSTPSAPGDAGGQGVHVAKHAPEHGRLQDRRPYGSHLHGDRRAVGVFSVAWRS